MESRCHFCRGARQIRISRSGLAMIMGTPILGRDRGNLPPEKLQRLRGGVAGMLQVAMAEAVLAGERSCQVWLCRDCGYWESET